MLSESDRKLLIKDLCTRLPYGVKAHVKKTYSEHIKSIEEDVTVIMVYPKTDSVFVEDSKGLQIKISLDDPSAEIYLYLHKIDFRSMNKDEEESLKKAIETMTWTAEMDWYNEHHVDYRDLIEKGLALEAPRGMYKI